KVQRRLVSYAHLQREPGADAVSVPLKRFEEVFLCILDEISGDDLETGNNTEALRAKEQELTGIKLRLGKLQAILENIEGDEPEGVIASMQKLEKRKLAVSQELDQLKELANAHRPLESAKLVVQVLNS